VLALPSSNSGGRQTAQEINVSMRPTLAKLVHAGADLAQQRFAFFWLYGDPLVARVVPRYE